jgi:hypothetical protein
LVILLSKKDAKVFELPRPMTMTEVSMTRARRNTFLWQRPQKRAPEEPKKGSSEQKDNKKYSMQLARIKHVHFDPACEAEDEERCRRQRARREEKKVGRDCDCTIRSSAVVASVVVVTAAAASFAARVADCNSKDCTVVVQ